MRTKSFVGRFLLPADGQFRRVAPHAAGSVLPAPVRTLFEADAYLSPRHAEFMAGPNGLVVRDLRSLNGVFLKVTAEENR